ncbi:hypothetical protein [uncultured Sutterella sp.]|uniref:hypothetical protein n=1 Tax=uncultured Sutterella sp. TaxID=286133 RepID=UPI0025EBAA39|nr:hypothetical protein [uncultured Sutterella sp.]
MHNDHLNQTPEADKPAAESAAAPKEGAAEAPSLAERFLEVAARRPPKEKAVRYARPKKGPRRKEDVLSTTVVLRLSREQLEFLRAIGGALWVRALVDLQIERLGVGEKLRNQVLARQRQQPLHLTPRAKRPAKPILSDEE